jgi:hypothetical protein
MCTLYRMRSSRDELIHLLNIGSGNIDDQPVLPGIYPT